MKKFLVPILIVLLIVATALWYFGHYRPTQTILKAEPRVIYKTTTPNTPSLQERTVENATPTHRKKTGMESPTTMEDATADSLPTSTDTEERSPSNNAQTTTDTPLTPTAETEQHTHSQEEAAKEAAEIDELMKSIKATLESAEATQARATNTLNANLPILAAELSKRPVEEQLAILRMVKTAVLENPASLLPSSPEFAEVLSELPENFAETAWNELLNSLAKHGYKPPAEFK